MSTTRFTILAALVAALGLTSMTPAFAAGQQRPGDNRTLEFRRDAAGGAFRFAEFSCNDRAADRLEKRLDRMADRLDLSSRQEALFEDFRTSALTAQTDFADKCETIRPGRSAGADRPDFIQRLEQRLRFDEARVAAMSELLPQFKTFYESLTDAQKRELVARRGFRQDMPHPSSPHHPAGPSGAHGDQLDG